MQAVFDPCGVFPLGLRMKYKPDVLGQKRRMVSECQNLRVHAAQRGISVLTDKLFLLP